MAPLRAEPSASSTDPQDLLDFPSAEGRHCLKMWTALPHIIARNVQTAAKALEDWHSTRDWQSKTSNGKKQKRLLGGLIGQGRQGC
eukprot:scaffold115983_cov24-Tisochrysis_lutea.AAC.2